MIETKKYRLIKSDRNDEWITFVHGFTHNNEYFMKLNPYLKDRYNIVLINLLGHGDRHEDEGPFNLHNYSFDIINILNELDIRETIYFGTHTGAACGLLLACETPSYIKGLILEGTPVPGIDIPSIKKNFDSAKDIYDKEGLQKALDFWFNNSGWFQHMLKNSDKEIIDSQYRMLSEFKGKHFNIPLTGINYNLIPRIKKIKIPCLMYNGQFDLKDFIAATTEISKENRSINTQLIENTGGFPIWEDHSAVYKVIQPFLEDNF